MLWARLLKFTFFLGFLGAAAAFIYASLTAPKFQSSFSLIIVEGKNSEQILHLIEPVIKSEVFIDRIESALSNEETEYRFSKKEWSEIYLLI
ncbi:MAG: hypothetical protein GF347_05165 [Candidatus Moranbacteria bacterium]|nr:hypothetical protein [Candidatus Moranbacteria bacterium]